MDVHFRPVADVITSRGDENIDARRVEATRELWDPEYRVEDGPAEPIEFLPRLRRTIDDVYPGMALMVSDWRFGGESAASGALVVALALGAFATEGVHAAAHADTIEPGSPAYFGFKLFGDYDDRGGAFEGLALQTDVDDDLGSIQAFAALEGRTLRLVLVNESADPEPQRVELDLAGMEQAGRPSIYSYSPASPDEIVETPFVPGPGPAVVEVAPMAVAVVEIALREAPEPSLPPAPEPDPDPDDDSTAG